MFLIFQDVEDKKMKKIQEWVKPSFLYLNPTISSPKEKRSKKKEEKVLDLSPFQTFKC